MKLRVPTRFAGANIAALDKRQYKPVFVYLKKLEVNVKSGAGMLFSGPPGVGKTWAMVALTREAVTREDALGHYFDYEFITAPNMFDRIPAVGIGSGPDDLDARRNRTWIETITRVQWLVINDLGKEYRGGALHEQVVYKLGRVLRERSERQLVTHITTNLALSGENSMKAVYGESVTSLLSEMMKSYVINGEDRRRSK